MHTLSTGVLPILPGSSHHMLSFQKDPTRPSTSFASQPRSVPSRIQTEGLLPLIPLHMLPLTQAAPAPHTGMPRWVSAEMLTRTQQPSRSCLRTARTCSILAPTRPSACCLERPGSPGPCLWMCEHLGECIQHRQLQHLGGNSMSCMHAVMGPPGLTVSHCP